MYDKAPLELEWWENHYKELGHNKFVEKRADEYKMFISHLPGLENETGIGVDYGNGLISVFERDIIKVDPLNEEYGKIIQQNGDYRTSTSGIDDNSVDYIVCVNVIDHTPDSNEMVKDICRMLKPGGRLYFGVNFDDSLSKIHYELWNEERVSFPLTLIHKEEERVSEYNQTKFWAIYIK